MGCMQICKRGLKQWVEVGWGEEGGKPGSREAPFTEDCLFSERVLHPLGSLIPRPGQGGGEGGKGGGGGHGRTLPNLERVQIQFM